MDVFAYLLVTGRVLWVHGLSEDDREFVPVHLRKRNKWVEEESLRVSWTAVERTTPSIRTEQAVTRVCDLLVRTSNKLFIYKSNQKDV